jgi:hypothetical protein
MHDFTVRGAGAPDPVSALPSTASTIPAAEPPTPADFETWPPCKGCGVRRTPRDIRELGGEHCALCVLRRVPERARAYLERTKGLFVAAAASRPAAARRVKTGAIVVRPPERAVARSSRRLAAAISAAATAVRVCPAGLFARGEPCGRPSAPNSLYCELCRAPLAPPAAPNEPRPRTVTPDVTVRPELNLAPAA